MGLIALDLQEAMLAVGFYVCGVAHTQERASSLAPRLIRPPSVIGPAIGTRCVYQRIREEAVRVGLNSRRDYLTRSRASNHEHGH
jgi:hypothetical protein